MKKNKKNALITKIYNPYGRKIIYQKVLSTSANSLYKRFGHLAEFKDGYVQEKFIQNEKHSSLRHQKYCASER